MKPIWQHSKKKKKTVGTEQNVFLESVPSVLCLNFPVLHQFMPQAQHCISTIETAHHFFFLLVRAALIMYIKRPHYSYRDHHLEWIIDVYSQAAEIHFPANLTS